VADLQSFKQDLQSLVEKFDQDKNHYLQKGYPEAQVRIDFLNPFFEALGWDIENKAHKPPHERDVIVDLSPEISLRLDYKYCINGDAKFFIEAKDPWVPLETFHPWDPKSKRLRIPPNNSFFEDQIPQLFQFQILSLISLPVTSIRKWSKWNTPLRKRSEGRTW